MVAILSQLQAKPGQAQPETCEKMAYGIVHFFPGGTKEQYEASIAAVHPRRRRPAGRPDLPRGRRIGWRLDDRGDPRLKGDLGAVPRQHPDAPNESRH